MQKEPDNSQCSTQRSDLIFLKGKVHPKKKILSSFTHPQVVPNLYVFLCSAEHIGIYSEECLGHH